MDKIKRFKILEIHPYKTIDENIYCEIKTAGMVCKGTQKAIHEALERQFKMLSTRFLKANKNTGENPVEKST